ncbi:MAG: uroporphyrinogen decarboxylase family protein [Candidatus Bathyarchaeia archaeon]
MTGHDRLGILEDAPRWWPNFVPPEFTETDQLEIERYCKKIVENVVNEKGMTPWERWKALTAMQIPDRPMVHMFIDPIAISRVLDCWSYSLKPGYDMYNYPELFVKANLAWVAKFNYDLPCVYTLWAAISMVEWGGSSKAKMVPTLMPTSIDPPVKTDDDWDRIHLPDVHRDGLLPASLWAIRKTKEFMKKYGVSDLMPLMGYTEFCPYPPAILLGMKGSLVAIKRRPELAHKAAELLTQFNIDYDKAMREAGADITISSGELGVAGMEQGKLFDKYYLRIAKEAGPNHLFADSGMGVSSLEYRCQTGSIGETGWLATTDNPIELQKRLAREYKKVFGVLPINAPALTAQGDPKKLEETLKNTIKTCAGPGFFQTVHLDYWATQENLEIFVNTAKIYGKEIYKELRK